jgi:nucleoside-diphosphate-sugar epimerase
LVFGSGGFVGTHIVKYLEAAGQEVVRADRVEKYEDAQRQIELHAPDRIVCCLGRTHTPACASIDGLEGVEAWPDLALANLHAPFWICRAAERVCQDLYVGTAAERVCQVLYVGTGCIYTGGDGEYSETDSPNFFGSAYSRVKASADAVLSACATPVPPANAAHIPTPKAPAPNHPNGVWTQRPATGFNFFTLGIQSHDETESPRLANFRRGVESVGCRQQ